MAPLYRPMPLVCRREPFDHREWLYEVKYDGYRAPLFIGRHPAFVSRNLNTMGRFVDLAHEIQRELGGVDAVIDGELVCLDDRGHTRFYDLMFGRGTPRFVAFDLLRLEGRDLRDLPLVARKQALRRLAPRESPQILYAQHLEERGRDLFRVVRLPLGVAEGRGATSSLGRHRPGGR